MVKTSFFFFLNLQSNYLSNVPVRMYFPLGENLTKDTGGLSSSDEPEGGGGRGRRKREGEWGGGWGGGRGRGNGEGEWGGGMGRRKGEWGGGRGNGEEEGGWGGGRRRSAVNMPRTLHITTLSVPTKVFKHWPDAVSHIRLRGKIQ